MAGEFKVRGIFIAVVGLILALTVSRGFAYAPKEDDIQNPEALAVPLSLFGYTPREMFTQSGTQSERPKNCYHFYVFRNMSSLLSDATKMLRQVHDKRERDWILTFIYRIKSLAEHLRSHPESQNYEECLSVDDDEKKKTSLLNEALKVPQQELYFVDDMMPNQNQKRSVANSETNNGQIANEQEEQEADDKKPQDNLSQQTSTDVKDQSMPNNPPHQDLENFNSVAESTSESISLKKDVEGQQSSESAPTAAGTANSELTQNLNLQQESASSIPEEDDWMIGKGGDDSAIIFSATDPDCLSKMKCSKARKMLELQEAELKRKEEEMERKIQSKRRESAEEEAKYQELLKERIRKSLVEELAPNIKKFRTVGGTKEAIMDMWRQSAIEIAKEEEKKRRENDFDYEEDGAAAGDLNSNDKMHPNYRTVAPSSDQVGNYKKSSDESSYGQNDVLVQQLYDAARDVEPHYRSTRSLDHQDEYLIISTHIPY